MKYQGGEEWKNKGGMSRQEGARGKEDEEEEEEEEEEDQEDQVEK